MGSRARRRAARQYGCDRSVGVRDVHRSVGASGAAVRRGRPWRMAGCRLLRHTPSGQSLHHTVRRSCGQRSAAPWRLRGWPQPDLQYSSSVMGRASFGADGGHSYPPQARRTLGRPYPNGRAVTRVRPEQGHQPRPYGLTTCGEESRPCGGELQWRMPRRPSPSIAVDRGERNNGQSEIELARLDQHPG